MAKKTNFSLFHVSLYIFFITFAPELVIEHIDARESGVNPGLYLQL